MGNSVTYTTVQLKISNQQYLENERTYISIYNKNGYQEDIVLKKDHPEYNVYMKYIREHIHVDATCHGNGSALEIDKLYPSPLTDYIKVDKIVDCVDKNYIMITSCNNINVYYVPIHIDIKTNCYYTINFEFDDHKRFVNSVVLDNNVRKQNINEDWVDKLVNLAKCI
jgi:hypothetical protein